MLFIVRMRYFIGRQVKQLAAQLPVFLISPTSHPSQNLYVAICHSPAFLAPSLILYFPHLIFYLFSFADISPTLGNISEKWLLFWSLLSIVQTGLVTPLRDDNCHRFSIFTLAYHISHLYISPFLSVSIYHLSI